MVKNKERVLKCKGRFPELRESLEAAVEIMIDGDPDYQFLRVEDLRTLAELVGSDLRHSDPGDRYFNNASDPVRDVTHTDSAFQLPLSLIPLITEHASVSPQLVSEYLVQYTPQDDLVDSLRVFAKDQDPQMIGAERLDRELEFGMDEIVVPKRGNSKNFVNLAGYKLATSFGLGKNRISSYVADTPFTIELHRIQRGDPVYQARTSDSGVLGIGFWLNSNNEIALGQIQRMRGKKLPKDLHEGDAAFAIMEKVATKMGVRKITSYSSNTHPQFAMYPSSTNGMHNCFHELFDKSAKDKGYERITDDGTKRGKTAYWSKELR